MSERGKAQGHALGVDRSAECAGDRLVDRAIQNAHQEPVRPAGDGPRNAIQSPRQRAVVNRGSRTCQTV